MSLTVRKTALNRACIEIVQAYLSHTSHTGGDSALSNNRRP